MATAPGWLPRSPRPSPLPTGPRAASEAELGGGGGGEGLAELRAGRGSCLPPSHARATSPRIPPLLSEPSPCRAARAACRDTRPAHPVLPSCAAFARPVCFSQDGGAPLGVTTGDDRALRLRPHLAAPSCARSRTRPRSRPPPPHASPLSTCRGRWRLLLLLLGVARLPRTPLWTDRGSSGPARRLQRCPGAWPPGLGFLRSSVGPAWASAVAPAKGNEAVAGGGGRRGQLGPVRRPQPRRGGEDRSVLLRPRPARRAPSDLYRRPSRHPLGGSGRVGARALTRLRERVLGARGLEGPVPGVGPGGCGCCSLNCQCWLSAGGRVLSPAGTRVGPGWGGRAGHRNWGLIEAGIGEPAVASGCEGQAFSSKGALWVGRHI